MEAVGYLIYRSLFNCCLKLHLNVCQDTQQQAAETPSLSSAAGTHSLLCPKTKSHFSWLVPIVSQRDTHSSAITLILLRRSLIFLALTSLKGLGKEWDTEIRNQTQGWHFQRKNYSKAIPPQKVKKDFGERNLAYLFHCTAHTWLLSESYVRLNRVWNLCGV